MKWGVAAEKQSRQSFVAVAQEILEVSIIRKAFGKVLVLY